MPALRRSSGPDLRENPESRLPDGELVELGIEATDVLSAAVVAALDLDATHRERLVRRLDGAELTSRLSGPEQVEVDLDVEDLLHAAHVGVAEFLVRVEE